MPYVKSTGVFTCPDDSTQLSGIFDPQKDTIISYAENLNLTRTDNLGAGAPDPHPGPKLAVENAPASTVLLCEINGIATDLSSPIEDAGNISYWFGNPRRPVFSPVTNAAGNNVWYTIFTWGPGGTLATGILGGDTSTKGNPDGPNTPEHTGGSNFLLCDGHAKWLNGASVSPGSVALAADCNQSDSPHVSDCNGFNSGNGTMAAGTGSSQFAVTFSPI